MKKTNIVMLRSNPVDPDSRVEKEANSLIKAGFNVEILAWDRSAAYKVKESFLTLSHGALKIYRFGIPAEFGAGKKTLKAFLLFQITIFFWLIKNRKKYNIIHACDFDTAFTAFQIARVFRKKMVFDIFDYLYTGAEQSNNLFKKSIVYFQHKIINQADGTIICTEKRMEQINGSKPKKLAVIHNSPPTIQGNLKAYRISENKLKIVYVGILQEGRFLIELGETIQRSPDCELHIGGFGKYERHFADLSENYSNIFYYGKLSYEKTLELENSCDIMTAIYEPSNDHYFAAPNKFYESLMLGKPVIMVKNTGMSEIVSQYDIGELMDFDKESLKKAIENLINRKEEWETISSRMKKLYNKSYSWKEMERRLLQFYSDIEKGI